MRLETFIGVATGLLLSGCASDRVTESAKTIGTSVSAFQADLSKFQDTVKTYQSGEQSIATGNNLQANLALTETAQFQTEWALREAKGSAEMFKALHDASTAEIAALTATPAPSSAPASVALPLDQLGSVAKDMDQIAQPPGTKADLDFLVKYGSSVNQQMSAPSKSPAVSTGK